MDEDRIVRRLNVVIALLAVVVASLMLVVGYLFRAYVPTDPSRYCC